MSESRDLPDRKHVQAAIRALSKFVAEVSSDLDEERGGVGWWIGQTDWKRIALLSDYLLDSLDGTIQSLYQASTSAELHREQQYADDFWLKRQWSAVAGDPARPTHEDFLQAASRGSKEQKRDRLITMHAEHCFYHLAQGLDRLSAAVVIAAAVRKLSVLDTDWNQLGRLGNAVRFGQLSKHLEDVGSAGRRLQDGVIQIVTAYTDFGPSDWLPWLLRARHTNTHRAPKLAAHLVRNPRKGRGGVLRPFYRQPGWDDLESLAAGDNLHGEDSLWLIKETTDTLEGLLDSTAQLCAAVAEALLTVWTTRRSDPAVLIQPGEQWPQLLTRERLTSPDTEPTSI